MDITLNSILLILAITSAVVFILDTKHTISNSVLGVVSWILLSIIIYYNNDFTLLIKITYMVIIPIVVIIIKSVYMDHNVATDIE